MTSKSKSNENVNIVLFNLKCYLTLTLGTKILTHFEEEDFTISDKLPWNLMIIPKAERSSVNILLNHKTLNQFNNS